MAGGRGSNTGCGEAIVPTGRSIPRPVARPASGNAGTPFVDADASLIVGTKSSKREVAASSLRIIVSEARGIFTEEKVWLVSIVGKGAVYG